MTLDTATLRAQAEALAGIAWRNEDRAIFLASGDEATLPFKQNVLALCDALDEERERERVRVLTEALRVVEWGAAITLLGTDYSACPCCGALYRSDGSARHREPCLVAAALATAKGET